MVTNSGKNKILSDLMQQGLAGDQVAYAQFLTQITPILRNLVVKKIPSFEVEDVVQEILISIHKARHTYDGNRSLLPWLFAIARFRMADYLRKHYAEMRHKTDDIDELENILVDVTKDHSGHELIDDLLCDVAEKHKKILMMMYVEGYTAKEIAAKINMNESAVKVAAHRAIKKIRGKFTT